MKIETGDAYSHRPIKTNGLTQRAVEQRLRESRRLFQRTLASWASDLLLLHSSGRRTVRWADEPCRDAA